MVEFHRGELLFVVVEVKFGVVRLLQIVLEFVVERQVYEHIEWLLLGSQDQKVKGQRKQ